MIGVIGDKSLHLTVAGFRSPPQSRRVVGVARHHTVGVSYCNSMSKVNRLLKNSMFTLREPRGKRNEYGNDCGIFVHAETRRSVESCFSTACKDATHVTHVAILEVHKNRSRKPRWILTSRTLPGTAKIYLRRAHARSGKVATRSTNIPGHRADLATRFSSRSALQWHEPADTPVPVPFRL